MKYSAGDLLDRLGVISLKWERFKEYSSSYEPELKALLEASKEYMGEDGLIRELNDILYNVNAIIFDLEKDIRAGLLDNDDKKISENAKIIRKINAIRWGLKNTINSVTGTGFKEVKLDHVSEKKVFKSV